MKILVTGGSGFIGSHTVDLLLANGYDVRILDSLTPPVHIEGQWPSYTPQAVERLRGDVRDRSVWDNALKGVDAVFHFAAYQDYLTDFSTFFHVNTVGTALLYEAIVAGRLPVQKVVFASSQAAYGEGKYRHTNARCPLPEIQYPVLRGEEQLKRRDWEVHCPGCGNELQWVPTDEAQVNPHNQYAMSKYTQEMIALNIGRRYNIPSVGMRYSIVQGPRQSFRNAYSGILRNFTQRLLAGKPPACYEDGLQVRDYVYVGDVARANLLVLQDARADFQVFNVGGGNAVTVMQYAEILCRKINPQIAPSAPGLYRFGDTRHVFSDISKLSGLGWHPTRAVEAIADEYIAWARNEPDINDYYSAAEERMMAMGTLRPVQD